MGVDDAKGGAARRGPVVTIVHTSDFAVASLGDLFAELAPRVEVRHLVDATALAEIRRAGEVPPDVARRLRALFRQAAREGADLVFSQCSSVGAVAAAAAAELAVPLVRIDEAMLGRACELGSRIGVAATLKTTLEPTRALLEEVASSRGEAVTIELVWVQGAFEQLESGDRAGHDERVRAAIAELSSRVDVVVCAQGSMARIAPDPGAAAVPVLTSPRLGVGHALEVLRQAARRRADAS